jgi:acyl-CoA thioester hydrolase
MHTPRQPPPGPLASQSSIQFRVRYHECDPMGVAHHASYAPWMEMGRTELLRHSGISYARLESEGVFLVIAKLEINYKRPIRYDDIIEVRTTWKGGGRVKIVHEYELLVVESGGHAMGSIVRATPAPAHAPLLCATASTMLACVDANGALQALPEWLASA